MILRLINLIYQVYTETLKISNFEFQIWRIYILEFSNYTSKFVPRTFAANSLWEKSQRLRLLKKYYEREVDVYDL